MDDPWPPDAPKLNKDFKKAHDGKTTEPNAGGDKEIVTKKQIEELEKQRPKPAPPLALTPAGVRPCRTAQERHAARVESMKQRLREREGKARDDFDRSASM